jgi:hypothetical protein
MAQKSLMRPAHDATGLYRANVWHIAAVFACGVGIMAGGLTDTMAHIRGDVAPNENVFTPPHRLMLGSLGLLALATVFFYLWNLMILAFSGRRSWGMFIQAIPFTVAGGGFMLLGAISATIFFPADLWGHTIWGFEIGAQSLYSLFHLLSGVSLLLLFGTAYWAEITFNDPHPLSFKWAARELMALGSRVMIVVVFGQIVHHMNIAEANFQSMTNFLRIIQFTDQQEQVLFVAGEATLEHLRSVSTMSGIAVWMVTGVFVIPTWVVVNNMWIKTSAKIIVLDFVLFALPAAFYGQAMPLVLAAGISGAFVSLLIHYFPIFEVPSFSNIYIVAVGTSLIQFALYSIFIGLMGGGWWKDYAQMGMPVLLYLGSTGLSIALILCIKMGMHIERKNSVEKVRTVQPTT